MRDALRTARITAATAFAVLFTSAFASAYCPTYTCEFDPLEGCGIDPATGCYRGGLVAHWADECLRYAVQAQGSTKLSISAEALQQVLEAGFATWSNVVCEGRGPGLMTPAFTASYRGSTRCDAVEYNCGADFNDNIVMFRDAESELSVNTIALSSIVANLSTGEILDVDIELNSRDYQFSTDPEQVSAGAHDLNLVVNHELGHLLGLSHSGDEGALMHAEYEGANRLPGRDDARGICDLFPVSGVDPECSVPAIEGAGSCVGRIVGCQPVFEPRPAPECSFRAPEAARRARWVPSAALVGALGLRALRRRAR